MLISRIVSLKRAPFGVALRHDSFIAQY